MIRRFIALIITPALLYAQVTLPAGDADRTVKEVHFAKGSSTAVLKGSITGYGYIDYRLQAGAGQTMKISMQVSNLASYFNVLPPGSDNAAMFIAGAGEKAFDSLLPADGIYTVRVYLMRSAARRKENSNHTLSISVTGKPLPPVSPKIDALIPGTPYHARAPVKCEPRYTKARKCDALVIRRGFDGTATVELRWDKNSNRRILFVKGKPAVADVPQPFTFTRDERGYVVVFDGDERFEIPEALVYGG